MYFVRYIKKYITFLWGVHHALELQSFLGELILGGNPTGMSYLYSIDLRETQHMADTTASLQYRHLILEPVARAFVSAWLSGTPNE